MFYLLTNIEAVQAKHLALNRVAPQQNINNFIFYGINVTRAYFKTYQIIFMLIRWVIITIIYY